MALRMTRAACLVVAAWLAFSAPADDVQLRVITFNTEQGIASSPDAYEAAGNQLTILDFDGAGPNRGLSPDIVCLQETRSEANLEAFRDDYLPDYQVIRGSEYTEDGAGNNQAYIIRGDFTVLDFAEFPHSGPRRHHRIVFEVPDTDEVLVVYNAHFKAGQTTADKNTRRAEANNLANRVALDHAEGIDTDGGDTPDVLADYYLVTGDFNQDDFSEDVIDALLEGGDNGLDPGLNDVRVETLLGAQFGGVFIGGTFSTRGNPLLEKRYDYVLASDVVFDQFDTDDNGIWTQNELNEAGFVYFSGDDGGQRANGDVDASQTASDHAAVVVDFTLPGSEDMPGDLDGDGDVDQSDLGILLANWGCSGGGCPGDCDGDGDTDQADLGILLANFGTGT
jgi:endonuclease/exonuclease/phosphatase family metal-dependent hydrolase